MNEILSVELIEKMDVFATIMTNEQLYDHSFDRTVYVECETLEMSEQKLLTTDYNFLQFKRNKLVNQQLHNQLNKEEQHFLTLQIESYNNKLNELRSNCHVTVKDVYPNMNFEDCDFLYSIKKEDFNDQKFKEIASDLVSEWAKEQMSDLLTGTIELDIKVTLSSGKILQNNKIIIKL